MFSSEIILEKDKNRCKTEKCREKEEEKITLIIVLENTRAAQADKVESNYT